MSPNNLPKLGITISSTTTSACASPRCSIISLSVFALQTLLKSDPPLSKPPCATPPRYTSARTHVQNTNQMLRSSLSRLTTTNQGSERFMKLARARLHRRGDRYWRRARACTCTQQNKNKSEAATIINGTKRQKQLLALIPTTTGFLSFT